MTPQQAMFMLRADSAAFQTVEIQPVEDVNPSWELRAASGVPEPGPLTLRDLLVIGSVPEKLHYERQHVPGVSSMMGRMRRSPITGQVVLQATRSFPNFALVDLWKRPGLPTELYKLKEDPFLFKPVALGLRTWIYHFQYLNNEFVEGGEDSMLRTALDQTCLDAPVQAGRWSSLASCMPFFTAVGLTGDFEFVIIALFLVIILYNAAVLCNRPQLCVYERMFTFPLRVAFLIMTVRAFKTTNYVAIVGFLVILAAGLLDFCSDFSALMNLRLRSTYKVLKVLPGRVFICTRLGPPGSEACPGVQKPVPEVVAGFVPWEKHNAVLAEIGGLIIELVPMTKKDWKIAREASLASEKPLPYVCLEVFEAPAEPGSRCDKRFHDVMLEDL